MYFCFSKKTVEYGIGPDPTSALHDWEEKSKESYFENPSKDFTWIKGVELDVEVKTTAVIKGN